MWAAHVGYRGQETDYMQRRYFMQDDLGKMVGNHVLTGDVSLWSMFHEGQQRVVANCHSCLPTTSKGPHMKNEIRH